MSIGETLSIEEISGLKHLYKVIGIDVVDSRRGSLLLDTEWPMLSLVTCYPFDASVAGGPLRYVVTAKMLF
jgi:sortase A